MLVLTRKLSEQIELTASGGEKIVLDIRKISKGAVKVGISAPQSVGIKRAELAGNSPKRELVTS